MLEKDAAELAMALKGLQGKANSLVLKLHIWGGTIVMTEKEDVS